MHRQRIPILICAGALCVSTVGCSAGDGDDLPEPQTVPSLTTVVTQDGAGATLPATGEPSDPPPADDADSAGEAPTSLAPISIVDVPETGVPGLDSDDVFCASWSRYGGSFQIVAVASAFLEGSEPYALEVIASPVVGAAYESLLASWPDALASEADLVANEFLGPFVRRSAAAYAALQAAGADDAMVAEISVAWTAALATRDPGNPEIAVELSPEAQSVVDAAAESFGAEFEPVVRDQGLVTDVETPLTDQFLAVTCPDQGSLAGQEVG